MSKTFIISAILAFSLGLRCDAADFHGRSR